MMTAHKLRKTGLRVLGDAPWGGHFSLFFETKEDLLEIVVPYLKAGVASNEFCLWVISEPLTEKRAEAALREAFPAFDRHPVDRQIEIRSGHAWYRTGSRLDLQKAATAWDTKLAGALAAGYDGIRVAASSVLLDAKEWEEFLDYEKRLNDFVADKQMLVLCCYSLAACRPADVLGVARAHPSVVVKRDGAWEVR